jgi:hypothetical protein
MSKNRRVSAAHVAYYHRLMGMQEEIVAKLTTGSGPEPEKAGKRQRNDRQGNEERLAVFVLASIGGAGGKMNRGWTQRGGPQSNRIQRKGAKTQRRKELVHKLQTRLPCPCGFAPLRPGVNMIDWIPRDFSANPARILQAKISGHAGSPPVPPALSTHNVAMLGTPSRHHTALPLSSRQWKKCK